MTGAELEAILKHSNAKHDAEGKFTFADGATLSLYVSRGGVGLNVSRIVSLRIDGGIVFATTKKETFAIAHADVYAASVESNVPGEAPRRAGF